MFGEQHRKEKPNERFDHAPLAQLVEHLTLNQGVQGSSPWRCTESTIFEAERFGDGVFFVLQTMRLDRVVSLKIGHGVIVDHVITSERIYKQLTEALKEYALIMVQVTCPLNELEIK